MRGGEAIGVAVLVCAIGGCGGDAAPEDSASLTFHDDVAPILNRRCQACHQDGGIGPYPLVSHEDVVGAASFVRDAVTSGLMPPWGANPSTDCTPVLPWLDDPTLTGGEVATLVEWIDGDRLEGTPPAVPLVPPEPEALARVDVDVGFSRPYVVSGPTDLYVCFPLDIALPAGSWIEGFHVVPGNRAIVHHANVFSDPTRNSLFFMEADGTVPCNGYPGADQRHGLGIYVPGARPVELPDDTGIYIADGSSLVIEIHYHPAASPEPDDTHVQLTVTDVAPTWAVNTGLALNASIIGAVLLPDADDPPTGPELFIPAGATHHVETVELTIPKINPYTGRPNPRLHVLGLNGHMHLLGKQAQVEVERSTGTECLLHEDYDFRWQRSYSYAADGIDALPILDPDDTLRVRCTYDNSLGNAALVDALVAQGLTEPIDVREGWTTLDEMCQATFVVAYEWLGVPF